ncbi:Transposase family tnp2 [Ceratobasidium sp. AG-Ba]|nr:Transposase family tnp2 [Ceratobasidium sp. AG-Ba]
MSAIDACPCCGIEDLPPKELSRHLTIYRRNANANLDALAEVEALDDNDIIIDDDNNDASLRGDNDSDHDLAARDDILAADNEQEPIDMGQVGIAGSDQEVEMDIEGEQFLPPLPDFRHAPGILRNPPVAINDWASEAGTDDPTPPGSEIDGSLAGSEDQEPEFDEDDLARGFDADIEQDMDEGEFWEYLNREYGERAEQEWLDAYDRFLTDEDRRTLRFLAARQRTHFSRQIYEDLRMNACEELNLPSDFLAWTRLKALSNLQTRAYDMCVNSCLCFLGKHQDLDACPFCHSPRYTPAGVPRRVFNYTPLIPQLISLFQNPDSIEKVRRRARHEEVRLEEPNVIDDVFDGEVYRTLRQTRVREDSEYRYFDNLDDIALGLGTDGFSMFKRRRHKGTSTAWPLILVNYNLHPSIRNKLENIICVGVIPGPKECKDINSFLVPLIDELLELADGVEASKVASKVDNFVGEGVKFRLHAFLIIVFGDIPAISKLLLLRGHGAIVPCRTCLIKATPYRKPNRLGRDHVTYYVPLTRPGAQNLALPGQLIPRTNETFQYYYRQIENSHGARREELMKQSGLNGKPVLARLGSIDLANFPNLVRLWKGEFKDIDSGRDDDNDIEQPYHISAADWEDIGRRTVGATRTIPGQFVGTLLNIDVDMGIYKAEGYSFWFLYIAPILLHDRLDREYYNHFLGMREIIIRCLELRTTHEEVDELEQLVNDWVQEYERLYYRYVHSRLPTVVLTIHALLHMAHYIRQTGPLSGTWCFVIERFCGYLLRPALLNRVRPYEYLDNFIRRRGQLQIVARVNDMPDLLRSMPSRINQFGVEISSKEEVFEFQKDCVLGQPIRRRYQASPQLKRQICRYFSLAEARPGVVMEAPELHERVDWETLTRYGRFRITDMGDTIRTAELIDNNPIARDNSYVRYEYLPDRYANYRLRDDEAMRRTYYARVLDIFYVEWIKNRAVNQREPYLLARIRDCKTNGLDAALPENPRVTYEQLDSPEVIHLGAIQYAVGRIKTNDRRTWAIIDRSRGARTVFNDEEGNPDPNLN